MRDRIVNNTQGEDIIAQLEAIQEAVENQTYLQEKTVTLHNQGQVITFDSPYLGLKKVTVNVANNVPALEVYSRDLENGYVSSGTWVYDESTDALTDVYTVLAGHSYFITLGATVGSRFCAMFTSTDVTQATSDVTGTYIINQSDPAAYSNIVFTANSNGYLVITKDDSGTTGLKSYVYDRSMWT